MDAENSYARLQRSINAAHFRYLVREGPLAWLAILWALGMFIFALVWREQVLVTVWTFAVVVIALCAWLGTGHGHGTRRAVLQKVLMSQLRLNDLRSGRSRVEVLSAVDQMIDVLLLIAFKSRVSRDDQTERKAVGNVYDALATFVESEIDGSLPVEERQKIAEEARHLIEDARRAVSERARQPEAIAAPRRLRSFLEESEAALERIAKVWRGALEGGSRDLDGTRRSGLYLLSEEVTSDLLRRREHLQVGFVRIGFDPGRLALQRLDEQYERLLFVLRSERDGDPIVLTEVPSLAAEAYRQAISALEDVLNLAQGVHPSDRERLQHEAAQLEGEIARLEAAQGSNDRLSLRKERLQSHRERLASIERQELSIEELLHECERCEVCLDRTRQELAALKGETASLALTAVTKTLRNTVERARSVQDELKHLKR